MLTLLVTIIALGAPTAAPTPPAPATVPPSLEVAGKPVLALTPDLLHQLSRSHAAVPASEHETAASFDGVSLRALLSKAGVPEGHEVRGDYLCWIVTLEASDGYKVVFALAELDPSFTDRLVLLADSRDGKPLDAKEAPLRLVVPDERRPARWIRQVTRVTAGPACKPSRPSA